MTTEEQEAMEENKWDDARDIIIEEAIAKNG